MAENIWKKYSDFDKSQLQSLSDDYRTFLDNSKTERETIKSSIKLAEAKGFKSLKTLIENNQPIKAGDKVYSLNMDKALFLFVIGQEMLEKGLNIIGSHVDSPRLDLKASPIYENNEICLFDTHYYGGIKKHQWTAIPLAIHGSIFKKDGTCINIVYGENESDPVLGISELLPHLSTPETANIKGEDLNIIVGATPCPSTEKEKEAKAVKQNILNILKSKGIEEGDLFSAELEIVPAGKARNFGLDNSMIMAYGQDDRVCAYTSLKAILEVEQPKTTSVCMLVDKEEIGSYGATAMTSKFFENSIAEIMNLLGQYNELSLRRCLNKSKMLSSDVTAACDPNYPTATNNETDAHICRGISFNKYTGSKGKYSANDANPEFIAGLRKALDDNSVYFQANEMGKVDAGGGGTISYIMAKYGMDVIDAGVPLLNMHAPWEISCKADIYEAYKCYKVFYNL